MASLEIRDLFVRYQSSTGIVEALSNVNLAMGSGEFTVAIGASGCGKTTLLSVIAGFLAPSQGSVLLDGRPVMGPGADRGVVFQRHALMPWLSVLDNVAFGLRMRGIGREERQQVAREKLGLVGLTGFESKMIYELSGGMQQRVGIARALATRPPVLLMDEPFGALDAQTRSIMQEELLKIWSKLKTTVVFVTHDVDEALYLSDRVFAMTNSPGGIKEEIRVDLGRPRAPEVALSEKYGALHRRVHRLIREESLKVFNGITS